MHVLTCNLDYPNSQLSKSCCQVPASLDNRGCTIHCLCTRQLQKSEKKRMLCTKGTNSNYCSEGLLASGQLPLDWGIFLFPIELIFSPLSQRPLGSSLYSRPRKSGRVQLVPPSPPPSPPPPQNNKSQLYYSLATIVENNTPQIHAS